MGFQTGLSGLNAASKSLDVISNNVANSGNVGFKFANTQFADVFAAALNGATAGVPGRRLHRRVDQVLDRLGEILVFNWHLHGDVPSCGAPPRTRDSHPASDREGRLLVQALSLQYLAENRASAPLLGPGGGRDFHAQ